MQKQQTQILSIYGVHVYKEKGGEAFIGKAMERITVKAHTHNHILVDFLSITFYDLNVTFGYTGGSPKHFISKYTQEV